MITSVIAEYGMFSSSAVICAYAVLAEPCPISALPVRRMIVPSGLIVIQEAHWVASGVFEVPDIIGTSAALAALAPSPAPTRPKPTTMPPAPFTKLRRVSVAPKMSMVCSSIAVISRPLRHRLGRALDRLHDRGVRAATAEVTVHGLLDLRLARILRRRQQIGRMDDHPVLAVAALRHLQLDPRLLQRMQRRRGARSPALLRIQRRQPLQRRHRLPRHRRHRRHTRPDLLPVQQHRAGTTLRQAAAEPRPM